MSKPWEEKKNRIKKLPDPKKFAHQYILCSSCSKATEPPAYICRQGHPICRSCGNSDITYCPYRGVTHTVACREQYVNFPLGVYKFFQENSTFTCPNKPNGCPMLMKGKFAKRHLVNCEYRNLPNCVFMGCDLFDCILTEYHFHLTMDHDADTIINNNAQLQLLFDQAHREKYPRRSPCMFYYYDARFVLVIHEYEERVAMWISLVHGPSTQQYKATFRISYNKPQDHANKVKEGGSGSEEDSNIVIANDEKTTGEGENSAVVDCDENKGGESSKCTEDKCTDENESKEDEEDEEAIEQVTISDDDEEIIFEEFEYSEDEASEEGESSATDDTGGTTEENKGTGKEDKTTEGNDTAKDDTSKAIDEGRSTAKDDIDETTEEGKSNAKKEATEMEIYKIISHGVHPMSMSIDDIIDFCECVDMPSWVVEESHLVKDKDNRLIWPIEILIECEESIYDDADVTIGYDDEDDEE